MSSCPFTIKPDVQQEIVQYHLSPGHTEVLTRCVGGYSKATSVRDYVDKKIYQFNQYKNSYPDWKTSAQALDTRKFTTIPDNGNISATIVGNLVFAPWSALAYVLEDSGESKLKSLIRHNS